MDSCDLYISTDNGERSTYMDDHITTLINKCQGGRITDRRCFYIGIINACALDVELYVFFFSFFLSAATFAFFSIHFLSDDSNRRRREVGNKQCVSVAPADSSVNI